MTRVALIADAHGNAVGLRAALEDLGGRRVDAVVSLGDVAQGGPQPVECLELMRETGARTVMGNSDAFLLDPFDGTGADVLAGGHLHVQQLRHVGNALYVNPGSVGLGYDHLQPDDDFRFDPWASYAILDGGTVEFHRVTFDVEELAHVTRASGLPFGDEGLWRWQPRDS